MKSIFISIFLENISLVRIIPAILVTNGFMILLYTVEFQEQNGRMIIYQIHNVISRVYTSMCVFVINAFKSTY